MWMECTQREGTATFTVRGLQGARYAFGYHEGAMIGYVPDEADRRKFAQTGAFVDYDGPAPDAPIQKVPVRVSRQARPAEPEKAPVDRFTPGIRVEDLEVEALREYAKSVGMTLPAGRLKDETLRRMTLSHLEAQHDSDVDDLAPAQSAEPVAAEGGEQ